MLGKLIEPVIPVLLLCPLAIPDDCSTPCAGEVLDLEESIALMTKGVADIAPPKAVLRQGKNPMPQSRHLGCALAT